MLSRQNIVVLFREISMMSGTPSVSFSVETEVAPAYYNDLLDYTYKNYLLPSSQRISNLQRSLENGDQILNFTYLEPQGKGQIDVKMKTGKFVEVTMTPNSGDVPQSALDRLRQDLIIVIQFFEDSVRRSTLYFAWVQGRSVVPEKNPFRRARVIEKIFFGNILFLFVLLIAISIVLFLIIGLWAALIIVVAQFLTVLFADRLVGSMSDWRITKENPIVHVLQYHLPAQERADFTKKYSRERLLQMKKEIYDRTLAVGKPIDCETASEVMSRQGLSCSPDNMATKQINVYDLVEKATAGYGLTVPKVALSNTMVPNAAASGPSPKHGIVLVTTGLLVQLGQEEILSVLGHELSHLKARDPFVLFGIVGGEYIFRIFFLFDRFPDLFTSIFGLIYVFFILGLIYFVAKFFEARADLDSAIETGNPKVLAEALTKIGFRRLQLERQSSIKVQDWITWDPHPPIYFRVERLENLQLGYQVRHTFIQSAKDCVRGFIASF
jgi:heat shock protein HtpX